MINRLLKRGRWTTPKSPPPQPIDEIVAAAIPAASGNRRKVAEVLREASVDERRLIGAVFAPLSRHIRGSLGHIGQRVLKGSDHHCVIVDWTPQESAITLGLAFGHGACLVLSMKTPETVAAIAGTQTHSADALSQETLPNHQLCQTSFAFQQVASLLLTATTVDYQLILAAGRTQYGWLETLTDAAELEIAVISFVRLAIFSVIEIAPTWQPLLKRWGPTASEALAAMLRQNGATVATTELAPSVVLIHNIEAQSWGRPSPRMFCERIWQLCGCQGKLATTACAHKQVSDRVVRTTPRQVHFVQDGAADTTVPTRLLPVPTAACQLYAVDGSKVWPDSTLCPRRPGPVHVYVNDGWHRCRNATHWLSGCAQFH
mmetsp:Transcript_25795/g.67719  ORF Transcript_25795/g.67719 Transcript_25795/m.67719 type:complete len:374 (+) Transcript_25795:199-1320(+)